MKKIKDIIVGTHNVGKFKEICDLLPKDIKKYSPKDFNIPSPEEKGLTFEENSKIKAAYFSKKSNLVCLSDDSGLEINLLKGEPGIYSSRWAGKKKDFNLAISKVYKKMSECKKNWNIYNKARFVCSLTIYWTSGKYFTVSGYVNGNISKTKKGKNGFGYDPIFIPEGYNQTFGELDRKIKMSIDHRFNAYNKLRHYFIPL